MLISFWWIWLFFMALFLLIPLGYGMGYRSWGPPYPRYVQRRRALRATGGGESVTSTHLAWGWGGDFLWIVFLVGLIWAGTALWWR
jgi:hypothetical protein